MRGTAWSRVIRAAEEMPDGTAPAEEEGDAAEGAAEGTAEGAAEDEPMEDTQTDADADADGRRTKSECRGRRRRPETTPFRASEVSQSTEKTMDFDLTVVGNVFSDVVLPSTRRFIIVSSSRMVTSMS